MLKITKKLVRDTIAEEEGRTAHVYVDNRGIPTLGNGKALVVDGHQGVWKIDPNGEQSLIKATGQGYTPEQRRVLQKTADNLNRFGPGDVALEKNTPLIHTIDTTSKNTEKSRRDRANYPDKSIFGVLLSDEEQILFEDDVIAQTELDFDRRQDNGINALDEKVPLSKERAALISVHHHCPTCVGAATREKIKSGDREAVAQEIETRMNKGNNQTVAKHRKREAEAIRRAQNDKPLPKTSAKEPAAGGEVFVHEYSRGMGKVQSHTRSRPDGDVGNNKSSGGRSGGGASNIRDPGPGKRVPGVMHFKK